MFNAFHSSKNNCIPLNFLSKYVLICTTLSIENYVYNQHLDFLQLRAIKLIVVASKSISGKFISRRRALQLVRYRLRNVGYICIL